MLNGVKSCDSIEVKKICEKLLIENFNNSVLSMNGNITTNLIDSRACAKPDRKVIDRFILVS